ncbi:hypothetical protein P3X46_013386 [Hevea brasiliensis]|uniref:Chloride channel protein n=1 Tax=Hevea brasiliensis TaxID=3981 RepID=A0ABQ9M5H5_HEVBR|nr:hypothetical protein P3X46_013386 [Hevea brasiliensis]
MGYSREGSDIERKGSFGRATEDNAFSSIREPLLLRNRKNNTSQIAIANVCAIESLDYEIVENELFKQDWRSRKKVEIYQYIFIKYYLAFTSHAGCNIILAIAAAALCAYVAPAAAGSCIPEVKAYLNGVDAPSILAPSTLFVKDLWCSLVLRGFIEFCWTGRCGLFGQGGLIIFDVSSTKATYSILDFLAVVFLGVLGGILGSLYNYWNDKILRSYSIINVTYRRGPSFKILLVIIISFLTSCCSYGHPWLAPCIPCPPHLSDLCPTEGHYGYYNTFQSPPNHYNDLASLFFNTNDDAFHNLLTSSTKKKFKLITLLVFFVDTCVLGIITYSIAIPSGLFIPVILAGASYGRLVGNLLGPLSCLDVSPFALLGAASFLGGTMRMTVSVCVILLELTNDLLMLPSVMLVLLISKIADRFNKGVPDQIVKLKGLPYMEMHAEPYMRHLVASDVVSGLLISFSGVENLGNNLGNMLRALKKTGHNGFSVIDVPPYTDAPELCGLVLRYHLLVLQREERLPIVGILTRHDFVPEHILGRYPRINHHKQGASLIFYCAIINILLPCCLHYQFLLDVQ